MKTAANLREQWVYNGKFVYKGLTYTRGLNDNSAEILLNKIDPWSYDYNPTRRDPIYCPLCSHQDYIGNRDLNPNFHKGFTIGKKGRTMYWSIIWHSSGHATIYTADEGELTRRWVHGDTMITIHFKQL